jgi:hypothetical protein
MVSVADTPGMHLAMSLNIFNNAGGNYLIMRKTPGNLA